MTAAEVIRQSVEGGIATLTIDRPAVRNALDHAGWLALRDRLHAAANDEAVRCIVLTGSGDRAFCAGADLRQPLMTGAEVRALGDVPPPLQAVREIQRSARPVIAAINGDAVGGGCELVLACHLRVAVRSARLGFPEIRFGMVPAAARLLPRLIGRSAALEWLLTGELVSAIEAHRLGLLNRLVDGGELVAAASALARAVAERDPFVVAGVLALSEAGWALGADDALRAAAGYFASEPASGGRAGETTERRP